MFRKRKGVVLSLQFVLVAIILIIFVGASTIAGFQEVLDSWRLSICNTQAIVLDKRLADYAESHKGFKWTNLSGKSYEDDKYMNHFRTRADYPYAISEKSEITSSDGKSTLTGLTGYIGREFSFTTKDKVSSNLYANAFKFIYVPLDEDGNEISNESQNVAFYDLLYYDRKGNVYASPQSYRNLASNIKTIIKGEE